MSVDCLSGFAARVCEALRACRKHPGVWRSRIDQVRARLIWALPLRVIAGSAGQGSSAGVSSLKASETPGEAWLRVRCRGCSTLALSGDKTGLVSDIP